MEAAERKLWECRAGVVDLADLAQFFPVRNANAKTFDSIVYPFGVLTQRGIRQTHERGILLRQRYGAFLQPLLQQQSASAERHSSRQRRRRRNEDPDAAPVTAVASNYTRTQVSGQQVLSGLLATSDTDAEHFVPIHVGPCATCDIGVFESSNGLLSSMQSVFASTAYAEREAALRDVSGALIQAIPYFQPVPVDGIKHVVAEHGYGPGSRFLWIRAFDYFHVYRANGLPILPSVAHLEAITHSHLLWRFRTLYSHAHILRLGVGGLLQTLLRNIDAVVSQPSHSSPLAPSSSASPQPLHLFSGHDVTLLPLLLALARAGDVQCTYASGTTAALEAGKAAVEAIPWPTYASNVSVELHCVDQKSGSAVSDGNWRVDWRFDNEQLAADVPGTGAADTVDLSRPDAVPAATAGAYGRSHLSLHQYVVGMHGSLTLAAFRSMVDAVMADRPVHALSY